MDLMAPSAAAWSSPNGDTGVRVLHGFTGNPTAMRPLAERLAADGYRVELPKERLAATYTHESVPKQTQAMGCPVPTRIEDTSGRSGNMTL